MMEENRTTEEIYKSLRKQKRKRIRFVVLFSLMLLAMAAISVYFIVLGNIDSFLDMLNLGWK